MALKRRIFTRDFKRQVVREVDAGQALAQVARAHHRNPNPIAKWRKQLRPYPHTAFAGHGHHYADEARLAALERMGGKLTMDNDLLKKALALLDERAASNTRNGSSQCASLSHKQHQRAGWHWHQPAPPSASHARWFIGSAICRRQLKQRDAMRFNASL